MRWRDGRRSDNVEDVRGSDGGGGGGGGFGVGRLGLGGVAAVVVISLLLGKNPIEVLGLLSNLDGGGGPVATQQQEGQAPPANDQQAEFVSRILGETEDVWGAIFQASGQQYTQPKLVLFSGRVRTACGGATAASGPFYCPGDRKVYLDMSFFQEMTAKLGGGGDFADAYVIAHEVGHHVQTLLGTSDQLARARQAGRSTEGDNGLSVRLELQADCYAGVWANASQKSHNWLESGDVEQALATATAIGDDRLQKQSQGEVVPDSFTHGTSQQRVKWFRTGFEKGDPNACDTFGASSL